MPKRRAPKRLRLVSPADEGTEPTVADGAVARTTPPPSIPSVVVSSPHEDAAAVIDPPTEDNGPPSFDVLLEEICKAVAGSRGEALTSLAKINGWLQAPDVAFVRELHEIGGVPHLLNFLKCNMSDLECVRAASGVLGNCLHAGDNGEYFVVAAAMAQQVVQRDGIHLLLLANDECTDLSSPLHVNALSSIWFAVRNVLAHKEARALLSKEQICEVWAFAIAHLESNCTQIQPEMKNLLLGDIFGVFEAIVEVQNRTDFKLIPFVENCLAALRRDDGISENFAKSSLELFVACWEKKLISTREEFESIIPFCILSIEKNPNNQSMCVLGLRLLDKGLSKVRTGHLEEAGILRAVSALLQDLNAEDSVKKQARQLMKAIYK
jgi:hypothetical protein